jgi:hypothetical protein
MTHTDRRAFLKKSVVATAGAAIGTLSTTARSYAQIRGANERINVAVIGIRNQGTVHLNSWCALKDSHNVQVRTLCDTDEALFDAGVKLVEQKGGAKPATTWDMRTVFDDKTIDVGLDRHAQPLARAGGGLGLPGRQARLRGEAGVPQHLGGPG